MNVLFLCTGNSARSILAEAIFNDLAPPGWQALSAGSHPTGVVHPRSLALLAREGIPNEGYKSKSWDNLPVTPDIVVTVCANADPDKRKKAAAPAQIPKSFLIVVSLVEGKGAEGPAESRPLPPASRINGIRGILHAPIYGGRNLFRSV